MAVIEARSGELIMRPCGRLCGRYRDFAIGGSRKSLKTLVGTAGFEPATPCTPSKCATRLRYVPEEAGARRRTSVLEEKGDAKRVRNRHPAA